jgi:hypothetical protein
VFSAAILRHEINRLGGDLLRCQSQITFVLAILVVDDHDHPAGADFFNCFGDVGEGRLRAH